MFGPTLLTRRLVVQEADSICYQCLRRLAKPAIQGRRRITTSARRATDTASPALAPGIGDYFWANGILKELGRHSRARVCRESPSRTQSTTAIPDAVRASTPETAPAAINTTVAREQENSDEDVLPHRRRKRRKEGQPSEEELPLDASNRLTTISSSLPSNSWRRLFTTYLSLSKPRLSFLIVLTTTAAYSVYPVPDLLQSATTAAPSLSTLTLAFLTTGTFLTCASANTLNMMMEPEHDAKMSRTRNRPLVRKLISSQGAMAFAVVTGVVGTIALYVGVNPTTAALGAANIFLYAGVYTPLKRLSVINTWAGAIVGAIPPLMGWTAAAGQTATGPGDWRELLFGETSAGGWLLAALLYCWQFPHFNALSWPIREEYKAAGYRMLAWVNPARNGRVALRYSILMLPICFGLAYTGVVEKSFVPISFVMNGWMIYEATGFWRHQGKNGSARGLFWASIWHLPLVLVLAMVLKKGLLGGYWAALMGRAEDEDDWEYDDFPAGSKPA